MVTAQVGLPVEVGHLGIESLHVFVDFVTREISTGGATLANHLEMEIVARGA